MHGWMDVWMHLYLFMYIYIYIHTEMQSYIYIHTYFWTLLFLGKINIRYFGYLVIVFIMIFSLEIAGTTHFQDITLW